jgi:hypothetical protein
LSGPVRGATPYTHGGEGGDGGDDKARLFAAAPLVGSADAAERRGFAAPGLLLCIRMRLERAKESIPPPLGILGRRAREASGDEEEAKEPSARPAEKDTTRTSPPAAAAAAIVEKRRAAAPLILLLRAVRSQSVVRGEASLWSAAAVWFRPPSDATRATITTTTTTTTITHGRFERPRRRLTVKLTSKISLTFTVSVNLETKAECKALNQHVRWRIY